MFVSTLAVESPLPHRSDGYKTPRTLVGATDANMDQFTFLKENLERITVVENSFGPSGRPLSKPGRFLVGEGRLRKQNRRKTQMKDFFLFNDILVYGSIILNGRWHKKQRIIPLGESTGDRRDQT